MPDSSPFKDMSEDDLLQSLKNIGFDTDCGACCMLFFTGYGANTHTCESGTQSQQGEVTIVCSAANSSILQRIKDTVQSIDDVFNSSLSWEAKFTTIFDIWSEQSFMEVEYYDPDTTYQEDVAALHAAIMEKYGTVK